MDMKKHFCDYKLSLKLEEIGFKEDCICSYNKSGTLMSKVSYSSGKDCECRWGKDDEGDCRAPLWQQVIDWFREKHNLSISVFPISSNRWFYSIRKFNLAPDFNFVDKVKSPYPPGFAKEMYYEAREAAILKCIELCKK